MQLLGAPGVDADELLTQQRVLSVWGKVPKPLKEASKCTERPGWLSALVHWWNHYVNNASDDDASRQRAQENLPADALLNVMDKRAQGEYGITLLGSSCSFLERHVVLVLYHVKLVDGRVTAESAIKLLNLLLLGRRTALTVEDVTWCWRMYGSVAKKEARITNADLRAAHEWLNAGFWTGGALAGRLCCSMLTWLQILMIMISFTKRVASHLLRVSIRPTNSKL